MEGDDPKTKDCIGESSGTAIDHNSPYYIHPSDSPKQLHMNVLMDINYIDWSQEIDYFLFVKKIEFVDDTI